MKYVTVLLALASSLATATPASFYELSAPSLDGKAVPLSKYKGKVTLVVNTASKCGLTPQYKDLEALYGKYKEKGLVVLGFPSNDFGSQEPGTNAEIKKFCDAKYKVSFPMFSKDKVIGADKQPVYQFLTTAGESKGEVEWNFEKFLIDRNGKVVGRFKSKTLPLAPEVTQAVETQLSQGS